MCIRDSKITTLTFLPLLSTPHSSFFSSPLLSLCSWFSLLQDLSLVQPKTRLTKSSLTRIFLFFTDSTIEQHHHQSLVGPSTSFTPCLNS